MPDEAHEVIFPQGIPITKIDATSTVIPEDRPEESLPDAEPTEYPDVVSTKSEGGVTVRWEPVTDHQTDN